MGLGLMNLVCSQTTRVSFLALALCTGFVVRVSRGVSRDHRASTKDP